MAENKLLEELKRRLLSKSIFDLRQVARSVGVQSPSAGKKERLLNDILSIASGQSDPVPPPTKGAPPKSVEYDRSLVAEILRCREISLSADTDESSVRELLKVSRNDDNTNYGAAGLLERSGGNWFIRVRGCREDYSSDFFVNDKFIETYDLREGDFLTGVGQRTSSDEICGLVTLDSVNGTPTAALEKRRRFEDLNPVYPDRRFRTERGKDDTAGRIIDLLSPVGAGQRALIISPRGSVKNELFKIIADGIAFNQPDIKIVFVLLDVGAEEAADYQRAFPSADIFASPMDMSAECHIRTAKLALEYAKRHTENSRDVVLFLDDIARLVRAYNCGGRQIPNVLETSALDGAKKYFAAALNAEEGGSLTIVTALSSDKGDPIDEAVYYSLKDISNMKVVHSSAHFSAFNIDIISSGANAERRLLSSEEIKAADKLRNLAESCGAEACFKKFTQTDSNAELCAELNEDT